jgi:anaerobic magnesium-protoporphyrin IX monomethyl ester cyclase
MKILFLYPLWTGEYKGIAGYFAKKSGGTYIPYNLAILAAIAENEGHEAKIIDAELEKISIEDSIPQIKDFNPDIVAMTGMTPFFNVIEEAALKLKENNIQAKICVGGPHVSIMEEKVLTDQFDYAFMGEGEEPWKKFLNVLDADGPLSEVPGLVYRDEDQVIKKTARTNTSKNLDIYPRPAYHLLKMGNYKLGTLKGRLPFSSIQLVRGCPWKCIFCASDQLETTRILKRSVSTIIDEIEGLVNTYGVKHFMIIDDVLTLVRKTTVEFCNQLIERKINITFEGSTRANLLDEELVVLMKKAGLIRLSFGLETVDEDMRKTMNKKVPLDAYREANALLNKHKIEALNSVMIGLPGESEENVWKTLNFLKGAREVKQANFAVAVPYPGTVFHDMATSGKDGIELLTEDFTEYKRYGHAVTNVGTLSSKDLLRLQNEGFVSIYSKYWRWWPVVQKNGIIGLYLTFYRMLIMVIGKVRRKYQVSSIHPSLR